MLLFILRTPALNRIKITDRELSMDGATPWIAEVDLTFMQAQALSLA